MTTFLGVGYRIGLLYVEVWRRWVERGETFQAPELLRLQGSWLYTTLASMMRSRLADRSPYVVGEPAHLEAVAAVPRSQEG